MSPPTTASGVWDGAFRQVQPAQALGGRFRKLGVAELPYAMLQHPPAQILAQPASFPADAASLARSDVAWLVRLAQLTSLELRLCVEPDPRNGNLVLHLDVTPLSRLVCLRELSLDFQYKFMVQGHTPEPIGLGRVFQAWRSLRSLLLSKWSFALDSLVGCLAGLTGLTLKDLREASASTLVWLGVALTNNARAGGTRLGGMQLLHVEAKCGAYKHTLRPQLLPRTFALGACLFGRRHLCCSLDGRGYRNLCTVLAEKEFSVDVGELVRIDALGARENMQLPPVAVPYADKLTYLDIGLKPERNQPSHDLTLRVLWEMTNLVHLGLRGVLDPRNAFLANEGIAALTLLTKLTTLILGSYNLFKCRSRIAPEELYGAALMQDNRMVMPLVALRQLHSLRLYGIWRVPGIAVKFCPEEKWMVPGAILGDPCTFEEQMRAVWAAIQLPLPEYLQD